MAKYLDHYRVKNNSRSLVISSAVITDLLGTRFSKEDLLLIIQNSNVYIHSKNVGIESLDSYLLLIFHLIDLQHDVNSSK